MDLNHVKKVSTLGPRPDADHAILHDYEASASQTKLNRYIVNQLREVVEDRFWGFWSMMIRTR